MPFVFRFQQLLQIAEHEENEVKNRLAQKDGQISEVESEINKYKSQHKEASEQMSVDLQSGDMAKVQMYPLYMARLQQTWEFHQEELERLMKQREKIIEELMEKRRNRRTYEKLKENDLTKYKKHLQKKEQDKLDEFGGRKKAGWETDQ